MASQENVLEKYKREAKTFGEAVQKVGDVIRQGITNEEVVETYTTWNERYEHVRMFWIHKLCTYAMLSTCMLYICIYCRLVDL